MPVKEMLFFYNNCYLVVWKYQGRRSVSQSQDAFGDASLKFAAVAYMAYRVLEGNTALRRAQGAYN